MCTKTNISANVPEGFDKQCANYQFKERSKVVLRLRVKVAQSVYNYRQMAAQYVVTRLT